MNFALLPTWQVLGLRTSVTDAATVLIRTCSAPCPDCPAQPVFGLGLCLPPSAPLPRARVLACGSARLRAWRAGAGNLGVGFLLPLSGAPSPAGVELGACRFFLAPGTCPTPSSGFCPSHEAGVCLSAKTQGAVPSSPFPLPVCRPHSVQGFQGAGDLVPTHLVPRIGSMVVSQCSYKAPFVAVSPCIITV